MNASPTAQRGIFSRGWHRLFGERDPIEAQLDAIEQEGQRLARVAHVASTAMLVLFSAGSLVALAGDQVQAIAAGDITIPGIIAVGVSTLLVLAMDTSMIYAASQLRLLAVRRENKGSWLHRVVLSLVAILEAGTYAYMSWKYERPSDAIAWGLIIARALSAPLLSVYLALARALPVTGRDILALGERFGAQGVLRDIAQIASDSTASLADKIAIYRPVAVNSKEDDARLERLFAAAQARLDGPATLILPERTEEPNGRPPTGPGTPTKAVVRTTAVEVPGVLRLQPPVRPRRTAAQARAQRRETLKAREVRTGKKGWESYEEEARAAWANDNRTLTKMQHATGMGKSSASKWIAILEAEGSNLPPVEAAEQVAQ